MTVKTTLPSLLLAASLLFFAGCGNDNKTSTETVAAASSQTTVTPEEAKGLKSLALTVNKINLNKDENTTVNVIASYDDGSSKEVTDKVEWIVSPQDAVAIKGDTLTAGDRGQVIMITCFQFILITLFAAGCDMPGTISPDTEPTGIVERGKYVDEPAHWRYSSARDYDGIEGLIAVERFW